jgi:hypothetical protein
MQVKLTGTEKTALYDMLAAMRAWETAVYELGCRSDQPILWSLMSTVELSAIALKLAIVRCEEASVLDMLDKLAAQDVVIP